MSNNVLIFSICLFVIAAIGLFLLSNTRSAKLSDLAKMLHLTFDKERDTITTDSTIGHLEFFAGFFRRYLNVFTLSDAAAFMRIADVHVFFDENPKSKPLQLTVFTAEMKRIEFPALKIVPQNSPFAPSRYTMSADNIPSLNKNYRVFSNSKQAGVLLTPGLLSLLKNRPNVYIEVNDNAFLYHEHRLTTIEDFQTFRLRATQVLREVENTIKKINAAAEAEAAKAAVKTDGQTTEKGKDLSEQTKNDIFAQAESMLTALRVGNNPTPERSSKKMMGISIIVLLLAAVILSLVAWSFIHRLHP